MNSKLFGGALAVAALGFTVFVIGYPAEKGVYGDPIRPYQAKAPRAQGAKRANNAPPTIRHPVRPDTEPVLKSATELPEDAPGIVVLVVSDALRADSLPMCGDKPTEMMPNVNAWVEQGMAAVGCGGVAPASWALPTLSSLITGKMPWEHDVHYTDQLLPESHSTLAEQYRRKGYNTVLLSSHPSMTKQTGVWQGFDHVVVAGDMGLGLRDQAVVDTLKAGLDEMGVASPLFLTVYLMESQSPYAAIPEGINGVPAQPALALAAGQGAPAQGATLFQAGQQPQAQQQRWLQSWSNAYDYGVFRTDKVLGSLVELLGEYEAATQGLRVLFTSARGEDLGAHGGVSSHLPPYDSVSRVPLVWVETGVKADVIPSLWSSADLFSAIQEGVFPEDGAPPASVYVPPLSGDDQGGTPPHVKLWHTPTERLWWMPAGVWKATGAVEDDNRTDTALSDREREELGAIVTAMTASVERAQGEAPRYTKQRTAANRPRPNGKGQKKTKGAKGKAPNPRNAKGRGAQRRKPQ